MLLRRRELTLTGMISEERLSTGWETDVPADDTLLRRYLFHHAALNTAFTSAGGGRVLRNDHVSLADLGRPGGYFNAAVLLRPPADWDGLMESIEQFFRAGRGEAFLWSAWPTPDLRERGWRRSGHPPLLVRPPLTVLPVVATALDLDVRPVTSPAELGEWEAAAIDGYPLPALQPAEVGSLAAPGLLGDERLQFFVGRHHGYPVAAAAAFVAHGIASLAYGATLLEYRRRGYWHRLALERLRANPDLWTTGVFSDLSRPGAEAIGFVPMVRLSLWILARP